MTLIECSYKLGHCKNQIKFWVTKIERSFYWYPLCEDHLNLIVDNEELELEQLQREKARIYNQIIDWEDLEYQPKIHTYDQPRGEIEITKALKEYRIRKMTKYIENRIRITENRIII